VSGALPRSISVDPYRFEDPTYIPVPTGEAVDRRARPAEPKESAPFWAGLAEGRVLFQRCLACRRYTHYPAGGCQWCGGEVRAEEVGARAVVNTFTPCYLEFGPGLDVPYLAAIVNPDCEPELQVMTNLVDCRIGDVRIGMPVEPLIVYGESGALLFYKPASEWRTGT
jgi:hypothetical protein